MRVESNGRGMTDDEGGLVRWVAPIVVTGVLASFVTLAWYAYNAGTQSIKDDDLLVVEADKTPVKEKPADPGGMQFPDQDKTVFETFSGAKSQPPKVETIVPAPEEPLSRDTGDNNSGTTTWVNDKLHKPSAAKPADHASEQKPEQALDQVIVEKRDKESPAHGEHGQAAAIAPVKPLAEKAAEKTPEPVKPVEETQKEASPKKVPPPSPTKHEAKAAHHGGLQVQLGAYRSEEEARESWNALQKSNAVLAGHEPLIIKANLGSRGIYYRLRVDGFGSAADAKIFCGKLAPHACLLAN